MERKPTTVQPAYEDFTPSHKWVREEGFDTLIVELPGFKKEEIRVGLEKFSHLNISGERLLGGNRWRRFRKELRVPKHCQEIHTRFENGHFYVKILPMAPKPMQDLVNVIVGVVLLIVMAVYLTSER